MKNEQNTVEEYLLKDADIFSGVLRGRTRNMYIEILRRNQQNSKSDHKIPANVQIFFIEIYEYVLVKIKDTKIRRTDMNLRRNLSWKN